MRRFSSYSHVTPEVQSLMNNHHKTTAAETAAASQAEKLEKLRSALEEFTRRQEAGEGGSLFDHEAEEKKAEVRRRALLLLDQRARSKAELRQRLTSLEFDPAVIDEVIGDLTRAKLLDDEDFAREWVRQRAQRRGKSARALDRELQEKGVDSHTRMTALEQIDADDERATARVVAQKKARSETRIPGDRAEYDKALRRVVGALARRGFPSSMSMELSREALDERLEELKSQ